VSTGLSKLEVEGTMGNLLMHREPEFIFEVPLIHSLPPHIFLDERYFSSCCKPLSPFRPEPYSEPGVSGEQPKLYPIVSRLRKAGITVRQAQPDAALESL
jgi:hypothetical protein